METIRASYRGFFGELVTRVPEPRDGHLDLPEGPGLGTELRPEVLNDVQLKRQVSSEGRDGGAGLRERQRPLDDRAVLSYRLGQ